MHRTAAAILSLFRNAGDHVSGESVSRSLGISRTAVWKHISALREAGFVIDAAPSRGYRLLSSPDMLADATISPLLETESIGRRRVFLATTGSTNADAFRLAEEGAGEGTVVLADCQTGGKGRRGREWASPAGVNLYCSLVLRPSIMPWEAPRMTSLSAVAVARAIEKCSCLSPSIKWPNDVLIDGRKVAGLLNEMSAETDGVNFIVLGIGVNLNMTAAQFPPDLRHPATSLMLAGGGKIDRPAFAAALLNEFEVIYRVFLNQGFAPIREEWERRCSAAGRQVAVSEGGVELLRGAFDGIDNDGALLVRRDDGAVERILNGDVRVL